MRQFDREWLWGMGVAVAIVSIIVAVAIVTTKPFDIPVEQTAFGQPSLEVEEYRSGRSRIRIKDMPSLAGANVEIFPGRADASVRYRLPEFWCLRYGLSTASSTRINLADTCENIDSSWNRTMLVDDYRWDIDSVIVHADDDSGNPFLVTWP